MKQDLNHPEAGDVTGDIIGITRKLVNTILAKREDMQIALHQRPDRLRQYLESTSASTSTFLSNTSGSVPALPSGNIQPDTPPSPIADVTIVKEPEPFHTLIEHPFSTSRTPSEVSDHEDEIACLIVRRPMGAVPTALWGPPGSGTTPQMPRSSLEDLPEGTIVRDRNDGRGPVVEYGRPRKSRSDTSQRSRRS